MQSLDSFNDNYFSGQSNKGGAILNEWTFWSKWDRASVPTIDVLKSRKIGHDLTREVVSVFGPGGT
jgi:hypothetical protein